MTSTTQHFMAALTRGANTNMGDRQKPLKATYIEEPDKAYIVDHARTISRQVPATTALYSEVIPGESKNVSYAIGVHKAVGGDGDFPVPGEILSAAIAACLDSCIRIVANKLGIRLQHLEVSVAASVDVRGTLRINTAVPVGFQNIAIEIDVDTFDPVPKPTMDALLLAAENSCVVMQTLKSPPVMSVTRKRFK